MGAATFNPHKSSFLKDTKIGRPTLEKKLPKITDFFGEIKDSTKEEKIEEIIQFTCHESLEQLFSTYLKKKAKEPTQSVSLKCLKGPPIKVNLG